LPSHDQASGISGATIVVTGLSLVTSLGKTARETFDRLLAGERGLRELTLFDPGDVKTRLVGEVPSFTYPYHPMASRTSELALQAARDALADAGIDPRAGKYRVGFVLGGTTAGMLETESVLATLLSNGTKDQGGNGAREAALSRMLAHPLSAPTDRLVMELGPFERARSLSSACSSGANALAVGAEWLELGLVDVVLCGGADSLCRVTLSGFNSLAALDPAGARPFDSSRRGLTLGEGAALVVLERADHAAARKKNAVCTLLGWAARAEAHHITNPEANGEAPFRAMSAALARAGLKPTDVDYVNAHGTGTPLNDPMETRALTRLFGEDHVGRVPVSSQKGMIGHTLAAAGAIEAVITALAIQHGVIPPTGGLAEPDVACSRLRHVMDAERKPLRVAISNSFGFGGMDTALVLGSANHSAPARPPKKSVLVTGIAAVTPHGVMQGAALADLPTQPSPASDAVLSLDLDEERARRLDRSSRIAAVACGKALGDGGPSETETETETGIVLGIAFGAVDATAEFMRRLRDKGPRMVRPADFPSLVPSSPAGHVSIYLGLGGPTLVVADLAASGECSIAQAYEMVQAGDVDRVCAGAVEERSAIVEEVLRTVFENADPHHAHVVGNDRHAERREGGVALVLTNEEKLRPGEKPLARLADVIVWRDEVNDAQRPTVPQPSDSKSAIVVLGSPGGRSEEIVQASEWRDCEKVVCSTCGAHEAVGGIAAAVAVAKVARGEASAALFVGSARGWAYAGLVVPS
jgi:3-oxoacyl-[acyl-carrier-protein] synthase II